jgi:hypothetical protein
LLACCCSGSRSEISEVKEKLM